MSSPGHGDGHDVTNVADGFGGPQDPAVRFGPDDVVADLAAGGGLGDLFVERAGRVSRRVRTDTGEAAAIDCLVRARRA